MANAIVFDFDGTLMDTEPNHDRALLQILSNAGVKTTIAELETCTGIGVTGTMAYFKKKKGNEKVDFDKAAQQFRQSLLPSTLAAKPFPGVLETVKSLATQFPLAVASNSHHDVVLQGLKTCGLDKYFPILVARDDCVKAKPDAEPYLRACRQLGFPPQECVAVEDSPTGLASAIAAQCRVIAFTQHNPLREEMKAKVSYSTDSFYNITPGLISKL